MRSGGKVVKADARTKLKPKSSANGDASLNHALDMVRQAWAAMDSAPKDQRRHLQRKFVDEIARLSLELGGDRGSAMEVVETLPLWKSHETVPASKRKPAEQSPAQSPRFPEIPLRVSQKDLVEHALKVIPKAAQFESFDAFRKYLWANLRFNAVATRQRNAAYLLNRFFPGDVLFPDLTKFAEAAEGRPELGDALFYLTCRSERIVGMVAESVVWPSLPDGGVARSRIDDFVKAHFPGSKRASQVGSAIVRTFTGYGVGKANKTRLSVSIRRGNLASFAYILHLENPEPGTVAFEKLLDGPMHKWLLWEKAWMVEQLYLLRHADILSKISEIDRLRQFTTKYSLDDAIDRIVPLLKDGSP